MRRVLRYLSRAGREAIRDGPDVWAKLIDFHTTLPSMVEELIQQRDERQRA